MSGLTDTAERLIRTMKDHYGLDHTFRPVELHCFPHLDAASYASFRADMARQAFEWIADLESVEMNSSPTSVVAPTVLRVMSSPDGFVVADYFQIKPRVRRRLALLGGGILNLRWLAAPAAFIDGMRTRHCVDLGTEFTDGTFLTTSNAESAAKIAAPQSIDKSFFPYDTPVARLMENHRARVAVRLDANAGLRPLEIRSLDELLAMQNRLRRQKVAHRMATEWVSKAELRAMARGIDRLADDLYTEVQRLLQQDKA